MWKELTGKNRIEINEVTGEGKLYLKGGVEALFDAEDLPLVQQYRWFAAPRDNGVYVSSSDKGTTVYLHRLLLDAPVKMQVDHVNHNPADNRRANLRLVLPHENARNKQEIHATSQTGARGVSVETVGGNQYYLAKVAVVRWCDTREQAEKLAQHLRTLLSSTSRYGTKGTGVVNRKGRWVATASRKVLFPLTPEGLDDAKCAVRAMRDALNSNTPIALDLESFASRQQLRRLNNVA